MKQSIIAEIKPQQLSIYLMFAIMYAKEHQCKLEIAESINKKLMQVTWDEDAELLIIEKPF